MAKTKTKKSKQTIETKDVGNATEVLAQGIRPNDLAKELGVDGKRVRAFLRNEFPRDDEAKNTSWTLSPEMEAKVRERFTALNDEDSDEE